MEIKIKKFNVAAILGFVCGISGAMSGNMFLEMVRQNGIYGLVVLGVFTITLIWNINFWYDRYQSYNSAHRIAVETAEELKQEKPDIYSHVSLIQLKTELENHLVNRIEKDYYVLFKK